MVDLSLWRDGAPIFVAEPPPFHPLSWLGSPEPLLVVIGIASVAFTTDRFLRAPGLAQWLQLTVIGAVAMLGLDAGMLPLLLAVVAWRAVRGELDNGKLAALVGAIITATLLTAFWWLPAVELAKITDLPPAGNVRVSTAHRVDHIPASVAGHVANDRWRLAASPHKWWPGWRAYADGKRVPAVTVNGATVGAFVPPDARNVRFRYRPNSFDLGLRLSALGVLLLAVSPLVRRVRIAARIPLPQLAIAALAVYAAVLIAHAGGVAGGADSSGYLNQSRLWRSGSLALPLELPRELGLPPELHRAFVPLGFVPAPDERTMVPSYPPGLPLHMAALASIAGDAAQALVSPLAAIGCILLLYLLARELGVSREWAVAAAAVLALCPIFVFQAVQPMSDVVATFWTLLGVWCARRAGDRIGFAAAAGAAFGIGVLVRPTHLLLLPALVLLLGARRRALLAFGLGGLPFAIAQAAISNAWYGSPLRSGYGSIELLLGHFPSHFVHYAYWLAALLTPLVFPLALAGAMSNWTSRHTRIALAIWFGAFFLFYCFYGPYETWWYTRFLLPAIPALLLLGAGFASARTPERARALPLIVFAIIAIFEVRAGREFDVLTFGEGERSYEQAAAVVREQVPRDAIVVSMQHSGSLFHDAGRLSLRYDVIDAAQFASIRAHAQRQNRAMYALLEPFEIAPVKALAPGDWVTVGESGNATLYRLE
ncbi:MAG TPA: glycosyltransferase family 39 protein [Thermoanaerobaculia bacterium]|nr:glycosyltransferase family 39 protein [Thermoanaerobaculia bacterium]